MMAGTRAGGGEPGGRRPTDDRKGGRDGGGRGESRSKALVRVDDSG